MAKLNKNFQNLPSNYLFEEIEKKITSLKQKNPNLKLINLGIGDATEPIPKIIINSICKAANELKTKKTFKGYRPSQGELFLRKKISEMDYNNKIQEDEIFISSGTKNDISTIPELFAHDIKIGIPSLSYPVYKDSNILSGKTKIFYLKCSPQNNFLPLPPKKHLDLIYLCSPNNPTGTVFTKKELQNWVTYAKNKNAIILYDGAYSSFIKNKNIPKTIFEIEGAKDIAIEFRSFSKTAGFTSLRLSYIVIPKNLKIENFSVNKLWKRRIDTKIGGVSYPLQKGGEAIFSKKGKEEIDKIILKYLKNAKTLKKGLENLKFQTFGGKHSPYIFCKTKNNLSSLEFSNYLLEKTRIVTIPGSGFGKEGEGFIRFSAFAEKKEIEEALKRLQNSL
jgi:LL-diaminopimelate aminotransferase